MDHFRGTMPEQQVPRCLLSGTRPIVDASQGKFGSKLPSRPFKSMLPPGTLDTVGLRSLKFVFVQVAGSANNEECL